jgi:hypothetical protein
VRIHFDTTVDELIDANSRYWKRTPAGALQRRRGSLRIAVAFTSSLFVTALVTSGAALENVVPLAALAVILGAAFWPLYGRLYNSGLQRRLRQAVRAQVGKDATWTCEIELRPEGAWSRNRGVEYLFDWSQLRFVEDDDHGIELHFHDGFVMARNKAFHTAADREQFLKTARSRLPPQADAARRA